MPVLVTGADLGIGPDLVEALSRDAADVRAYAVGEGDLSRLQASQAFVAVGDLDDEGHLDAAMTDVHTVIVPTDTWLADPDDLLGVVPTIVTAADLAGVRRVVLVSLVGADPDSDVAVLSAFGHAEELVATAGMQTLVVRTDGIAEHGFTDVAAAVDCDDQVAPVPTARLVDGLVALDAARSGRDGGHALFTALGEHRSLSSWRSDGADDRPGARTPVLVGRRWLAPGRRADLRAGLCGRGRPPVAGSDLWAFVTDPTGADAP